METEYIQKAQRHLSEVITDLEIIQDRSRTKEKKPTIKKKVLERHINKLKVAFCILNTEIKNQSLI